MNINGWHSSDGPCCWAVSTQRGEHKVYYCRRQVNIPIIGGARERRMFDSTILRLYIGPNGIGAENFHQIVGQYNFLWADLGGNMLLV